MPKFTKIEQKTNNVQSKEKVKFPAIEYYNFHAKDYFNKTINNNLEAERKEFLTYLPENSREILDLGSGSGRDTIYFIQQGYNLTAIEGAEELAQIATKHIRNVTGNEKFKVTNMLFQDLSFENKFDGIWSIGSLDHVPINDIENLIKKLIKSLKRNGVMWLSFRETESDDVDGKNVINYTTDKIDKHILSITSAEMDIIKKSTKTDSRGRENLFWHYLLLRKRS